MAASSSAGWGGSGHAVLVMLGVGKPWSEDEDGMNFESWWSSNFGDDTASWPHGLTRWNELEQGREWVTGISSRAGIDGTLKPRSAIIARDGGDMPQASGAGVAKLVFRPVRYYYTPAGEFKCIPNNRLRMFGIFPTSEMHVQLVDRRDTRRNVPQTMRNIFSDPADMIRICEVIRHTLDEELASISNTAPAKDKKPGTGFMQLALHLKLAIACWPSAKGTPSGPRPWPRTPGLRRGRQPSPSKGCLDPGTWSTATVGAPGPKSFRSGCILTVAWGT